MAPVERAPIRERALGAYLGLAVGDALGAPAEFMTPREVTSQYGVLREMVGGGWLRIKPGRVTDDTEMAFALGAALIEANGLDVKTIADHFVGWMKSRPIDMGATVRRGIRRYIATGSLEAPLMDDAAGNGGVMRNLPVILATLNDAAAFEAWTLAQCRFTHHNEKSDAGSIYLSELTRMAILEGQRAPLATFARDTIDRLGIGFDHTRFRSGPSDGYILSTIQIALYFFFNTYDFESLLIGVVNQGGDADTNAAIAGQMGGAFYGPEAIPKRWLAKLDKQVIRTIEEQVDRLLALSGDRYGLD